VPMKNVGMMKPMVRLYHKKQAPRTSRAADVSPMQPPVFPQKGGEGRVEVKAEGNVRKQWLL